MNREQAKDLRDAARRMREEHGPEHERHEMWSLMADLLGMASDHAVGRGSPCSSCLDQTYGIALAYLTADRAAVAADPADTGR